MRDKSYLQIGSVTMGIGGSIMDQNFLEEYLGMRVESIDEVEILRRIDEKIYNEDDYKKALKEYLSEKVLCLKKAGAEVISLTAVTMHIVFEELVNNTGVSLISIPKAVCKEVKNKGYRKILLLGTIFTMEQDYMKNDFRDAGIEVFIPDEDDRNLVAKRIFEELELGIVKESTLKEFQSIIDKMRDQYGIEAVILGCTELPLLMNSENCSVPCLDSVEIHINDLIHEAI